MAQPNSMEAYVIYTAMWCYYNTTVLSTSTAAIPHAVVMPKQRSARCPPLLCRQSLRSFLHLGRFTFPTALRATPTCSCSTVSPSTETPTTRSTSTSPSTRWVCGLYWLGVGWLVQPVSIGTYAGLIGCADIACDCEGVRVGSRELHPRYFMQVNGLPECC